MNTEDIMRHHLGNISRQVGHDVSNRYSYIVNQEDLTNAWLQMHNDLGYPLRLDSKYRRAIIYNKQGLEMKINNLINDTILANINELNGLVLDDLSSGLQSMLNSITQSADGSITIGKVNRRSGGSSLNRFAKALGRGLVKGMEKIIDEMTSYKEEK